MTFEGGPGSPGSEPKCTRQVVKVAVSGAVPAADKPYDYLVPPALADAVRVGARVLVPFGAGNRKTEALVLRMQAHSEHKRLKAVLSVLDDTPPLSEALVDLALWMRKRYFCTCFEAARAMLPTGLWYARKETVTLSTGLNPEEARAMLAQAPRARLLLEALLDAGGTLERPAVDALFAPASADSALKTLTQKGLLQKDVTLKRQSGDRMALVAELNVSVEEAEEQAGAQGSKSPARARVLRFLIQAGRASIKEIHYFTGASLVTVKRLSKEGLLLLSEEEEFRRPAVTPMAPQPFTLSDEQEAVYRTLCTRMEQHRVTCALLQGVTGSGKTSVYLKLIQDVIERGGGSIVMVPEIVLTPQLMQRFYAEFGDKVALLHSGLSIGERFDEWKRVRSGQVQVVLGTRSAVFAPIKNLKLIILDEEQEYSYKSENAPRYHAREIALYRIHQSGGLVLLGSATPALETAYHARTGRYLSLELKTRFNQKALPEVILADRREDLLTGQDVSVGRVLQAELKRNLEAREQSILFLNRRGHHRYFVCMDCGKAPGCPRCSVSLTYHSMSDKLMCHYCGHVRPRPEVCPHCGQSLRPVGMGTQKVEEDLHALFPGARVLRMDADTTGRKGAHEKLLTAFRREKVPILIGTQMVTKGLDFANVTLVGVLDADMSMMVSDFRAHERSFSLLTQVVGRAGRGASSGRAVLQTFSPRHPVLLAAARQDYDAFYEEELQVRRAAGLPPFGDVVKLGLSGLRHELVRHSARRLRDQLDSLRLPLKILGPAPAPVLKVNLRYRYAITLLGTVDTEARGQVEATLRAYAVDKNNAGVSIYADLNPYE